MEWMHFIPSCRCRRDLEQHVPQLLAKIFHILVVHRLKDLLGLVGQALFQALKGLLLIPGAAVVRAQLGYDTNQPLCLDIF